MDASLSLAVLSGAPSSLANDVAFPVQELLHLAGDADDQCSATATAIAGLAFELHVQRMLCEYSGRQRVAADCGAALCALLFDGSISRSTYNAMMQLRRDIRLIDLTDVEACRSLFERIFAFLKGGAL